MTHSSELSSQTREISSVLVQSREWTVPSFGQTLKRDDVLQRFDAIAEANVQVSGSIHSDFQDAYATSTQYIHTAFDRFEERKESNEYDWVFAVPARGEESQNDEYASEVTFFLPILDPKFGVNALVRQRTVAFLAPTVIEEYKGDTTGTTGALLWTPAYIDPSARRGREFIENLDKARYRVNEAARFAHDTLGARVMGLGAIIPGLTKFGTTIKQEGLTSTTGHGGTVHIVAETVQDVAERKYKQPIIGVLGLGSIGYASLKVLRENADTLQAQKFVVYDTEAHKVANALDDQTSKVHTEAATFDYELLQKADIIVTAVTRPIDLNELERKTGRTIELHEKTIIDDSQPGCFDRDQVEARGGKLVWVVGEDASEQHAFKRLNGYSFGESGGLYGDRAVWGCEAEAGSIAMSGYYDLAINSEVKPDMARKIGKICKAAGVSVSGPLQSYGQPVDI